MWRYDDGQIVHDEERQTRLGLELRAELRELSAPLLGSWRNEPDAVRRALLLLLAHTPALRGEYSAMAEESLPVRFREAWLAIHSGANSQEAFDEIDSFERGHTATLIRRRATRLPVTQSIGGSKTSRSSSSQPE